MGSIIDPSEVYLELGISTAQTNTEQAVVEAAIKKAEGAVKRYLKYDPVLSTRTEFYPQSQPNFQHREAVWEVEGSEAILRRRAEVASTELQLKGLPIRSDTDPRVFIDYDGRSGTASGAFAAETEKTLGTDFWPNYDSVDSSGNGVCKDGILHSFGSWPTTIGSVKVIYRAGYSASELSGDDSIIDATPIWEVALDEAARRAKKIFVSGKHARVGFAPGVIESERAGDYSYKLNGDSINQLFAGNWALSPANQIKLAESGFVHYGLRAL